MNFFFAECIHFFFQTIHTFYRFIEDNVVALSRLYKIIAASPALSNCNNFLPQGHSHYTGGGMAGPFLAGCSVATLRGTLPSLLPSLFSFLLAVWSVKHGMSGGKEGGGSHPFQQSCWDDHRNFRSFAKIMFVLNNKKFEMWNWTFLKN